MPEKKRTPGAYRAVKRLLDVSLSAGGLVCFAPVLAAAGGLVWLQDGGSPLFVSTRIGRDSKPFQMIKIRSMVQSASSGAQSTSADDARITRFGHVIRRFKLDELPQLVNVLRGEMSLVGPRPNVPEAVADYEDEELILLTVRPGVTDIASIVFSDEGEILRGHPDPDAAYEQLIRPGKSQLGLLYVRNAGFGLDMRILCATFSAIFSRELASRQVTAILADLDAPDDLRQLVNEYRLRVVPRGGSRVLADVK